MGPIHEKQQENTNTQVNEGISHPRYISRDLIWYL